MAINTGIEGESSGDVVYGSRRRIIFLLDDDEGMSPVGVEQEGYDPDLLIELEG